MTWLWQPALLSALARLDNKIPIVRCRTGRNVLVNFLTSSHITWFHPSDQCRYSGVLSPPLSCFSISTFELISVELWACLAEVWVLSGEMKECDGCGEVITVMDTDRLTGWHVTLYIWYQSPGHSPSHNNLSTQDRSRQHEKYFPTNLRKSFIPLTNIPLRSCHSHICYNFWTAATDKKTQWEERNFLNWKSQFDSKERTTRS